MPVDGIVINAVKTELHKYLIGGRIDKIYQPHKEELHLLIRNNGENFRLLISAASNNPRLHITEHKSDNPTTPPMFCMLLRKHITGGRILNITQPNFERIVSFEIENYNDLGDLIVKNLTVEIMGRHSNIILINENNKVIDCIKHVDITVSTVRQVLPGIEYTYPPDQGKINPLEIKRDIFINLIRKSQEGLKLNKFFMNTFTGISPLIARELSFLSDLSEKYIGQLGETAANKAYETFKDLINTINEKKFVPTIIKTEYSYIDFSAIDIKQYRDTQRIKYDSISKALDVYFYKRDYEQRLKQRSSDTLRLINTNLERCRKKLILQNEKLKESKGKDKFKKYGDLLTANIYMIEQGMKDLTVTDFYSEDNNKITIPLKTNIAPSKNAQRYYNKYNKAKKAEQIVSEQIQKNLEEIDYLETLFESMSKIETFDELKEIREELYQQGYIKRQKTKKGKKTKEKNQPTKPKIFKSTDGFDILVGKNNKQNDYVTLKLSKSNDIWFHTKNIPGSHVVIKNNKSKDIPDNTLLEAASIAAFFSKAKASSQVPVDFTEIKNVKKPSGAKPGMVIYDNYNTIYITPNEKNIKNLEIENEVQ